MKTIRPAGKASLGDGSMGPFFVSHCCIQIVSTNTN